MAVQDKVYDTRYFTYYLEFPDGEVWVDQTPFVHELQWELEQLINRQHKIERFEWKTRADDLARKGETRWTDQNGVKHIVLVENTKRNRRWGVRK